jgi:hypothetical protein
MKKYYQDNSARLGPLIIIAFFAVAIYVLTPRFWEIGGESFKAWIAARILRETGGFPVFSLGPAYIAYLQLFSFFDYPLSVRLEYFLTHLFASVSLFYLVKSFVSRKYAFLLICAWIPLIAVVEGGYAVMGLGFLALYLTGRKQCSLNQGYSPPLPLYCSTMPFCFLPLFRG